MRNSLLSALALSLAFAGSGRATGDDAPAALIEKAVKAIGGEEVLGKSLATHYRMRGNIPLGGKDTTPVTGDVFVQPNGDFKYALQIKDNQMAFDIVMVLVGEKGWRNIGGMVEDLDEASLAEMKFGRYYDRVTTLVPLLKDKTYTLASLAEVTIHGKPAVGVRVSSKGQPDVKIFFDKASGLPVKTEYRFRDMLHESYLSDWREPNFTAADEETLKAGKLNTDGPALLDYLRKKTPAGGNTAKINTLIEQLGDDSFEKREKASAELIAMGAAALPQLRQALQSNDTEIQRRAKLCVKAIGQPPDDASVAAAVRLLGWRKPPGTAEVLLTWATRLADDPLGREVQAALAAVAVVDGKPDEALVKALDDKDERRRALAGAALGKDPEAGKKPGRRLYIRGMKVAMKAVQHQGGAKILEREFTDVEYFNRFEDGLFARPR